MNIIIANDTCAMEGGSANMALTDARLLSERGYRVIFFSACGVPPNQQNIEWISLGQKNILDEPRRWLAMNRGLWNWTAAHALRQLLRRFSPADTVIHLHSWSKALTGSVVWVANRAGFKVVATLHDYFLICPNGSLYDYPSGKACALRPMSRDCVRQNCDSRSYPHKLWRVLRQWVWRASGLPQRLSHVIAVSSFSHRKFERLMDARLSMSTISNTIMAQSSQAVTARAGVAYMGRVSPEKGVDLFLAACSKAKMQAEVLGDGPSLPALKARWDGVIFHGWKASSEIQQRLSSLLLLVIPSYLYETYGLVAAEAAAAGVAVIVADQCAAAELVEDGVTGLHFRSGDVDDLALKITSLTDDAQRAAQMGQVAAARFWAGYQQQVEDRMAKLLAVYQQVLDRPITHPLSR